MRGDLVPAGSGCPRQGDCGAPGQPGAGVPGIIRWSEGRTRRDDDLVEWDEKARAAVALALNEADVLGIRLEPGGAWCDLLLHVLALPQVGPIDPDARRILRLTSPAQLSIVLRADHAETPSGYGPVIPLACRTWPRTPSIPSAGPGRSTGGPPSTGRCPGTGPFSPAWPCRSAREPGRTRCTGSTNAGGPENGRDAAYCLEGTVTFEDLQVLDASLAPLPLDQCTAHARRYWDALRDRDERLSSVAQRTAQDDPRPGGRSSGRARTVS